MKSIRGTLGEIDDLGVVGGAEVDIFIGCYWRIYDVSFDQKIIRLSGTNGFD